MITEIVAIASILIAGVSLYISIKVYYRDTPKLLVSIDKPEYECFFGNAHTEHDGTERISRISGIKLKLRNPSQFDIEVSDVKLQIKSVEYRLIPMNNPYWGNVTFLSRDYDTKELIPDYNYSIAYAESGFLLPCVVKSYSVIDAVMLFYDFPQDISHSVSATLRIESAAGIIRKRVKLFEYKDTFQRQEMEEVDKSYNSFHEEYKQ